jgi:RNA polymerase sigma factor (sigma-70 family)
MSGETTADLENLIERLRRGDVSARGALLDRVYHRLRRIAARVLHRDFRRLEVHHELDSVVDETWAQLMKALETTTPSTADEFYRLIFRKVRHVLLDLARRQTRDDARRRDHAPDEQRSGLASPFDPGDSTYDPSSLAFWTEFHREVENLPDNQRIVFDFHYFAEFPQTEIARLLDLHPRQVSRLWIAATVRLARRLDGIEELL